MAPSGSRNHNTAAVAAMSIAENSSCWSASDAEGSRSRKRPHSVRSRPSRHPAINSNAPANTSPAPTRNSPGGRCNAGATEPAPHIRAAAPTTEMPSMNASALKAIAREMAPASTPVAP